MEPTAQPRSPARTRASTPHTTPPAGGSAPTLRPHMLPAARRPGLNDALNAAMSLHNTTLCAIHDCSTLHTHAHLARALLDFDLGFLFYRGEGQGLTPEARSCGRVTSTRRAGSRFTPWPSVQPS